MLTGAGVVCAAGAFFVALQRAERLNVDFQPRDVLAGWRVPWYVLNDLIDIIVVLLRDLLGRRAPSLYRVCGFRTSHRDARLNARRVLATVYSTTSPNLIVIGIDTSQSRMLFHQIKRASVPAMTQDLGAAGKEPRA